MASRWTPFPLIGVPFAWRHTTKKKTGLLPILSLESARLIFVF
jgi:hypothetical protein